MRLAGWALFFLALAVGARAQDVATRSIEELNLSYVYAPIFGTGIYHAGAEQTTVLKLPAHSFLLNQTDDADTFWLLPVTFGVRRADVEGVIDDVLDGELHDMTFMPGLARRYNLAPQWQLSASAQVGVAHDFTLDTSRTLYTTALRATRGWRSGENRWTWGSRFRLAGQNKLVEGKRQGFGLLETGVEWETPTRLRLMNAPLHFSVYGIAQYFIQHTGIKGVEGEPIGNRNLYSLGFSVGWAAPVELLGVSVDRVGMTFIGGDDVRAVTFNLGFPLASD